MIDLSTFKELKITRWSGLGKILASKDGDVYVVTRGENINKGDYHLVAINTTTDEVNIRREST